MALIGEILTKIKVDASQQKSELTKAKKALLKFQKVSKKAMTGLKVGAVGATAALVGVVALVNKTADSIDLLAKRSDKLGITVAALQKLEFQASQTGVSSDKLAQTLQRMTRGVSEAAIGTGTATKALKELGLDANKLNKLKPNVVFNKIAEAMKKITNQSDKVRLSMQIFGREGVSLVNTMNSNLKATSKRFDQLGISITQSQAKAVEAFNDSKDTLGRLLGGFAQQLTVQLAPAFKFLIDKITEMVIKFGGMGEVAKKVSQVVLSVMSGIIGGINGALNAVDSLIIGFNRALLALQKLNAASTAFFAPVLTENFINRQFDAIVKTEKKIAELRQGITSRQKFTGSIQEGLAGANKAIGQASNAKGQITIKVQADSGTVVKEVVVDPAIQRLFMGIVKEETAKLGR